MTWNIMLRSLYTGLCKLGRMTGVQDRHSPGDVGHDDIPTRILDAAARCFYRDGIWASGVDTLAEEANVSKRTLYNHFGSKDGVIAAYLRQREEHWQTKLHQAWEEIDDDPIERVAAYVRAYARPVQPEVFRGSAFINAAAELADEESEALSVIQHSMNRIEAGVRDILSSAGYADADVLATRILYLLEGAVTVGGVRRDASALDDAEQMIRDLLESNQP